MSKIISRGVCLAIPQFAASLLKERVHSEIYDKIKISSNIVPFAFIFSKSVSFPFCINSSPKISLLGTALSLPGACIIASEDLHFDLRDLHYCFRTCIITSGTCIITSRDLHYCFRGPAFSLPGPALLLTRTCILP